MFTFVCWVGFCVPLRFFCHRDATRSPGAAWKVRVRPSTGMQAANTSGPTLGSRETEIGNPANRLGRHSRRSSRCRRWASRRSRGTSWWWAWERQQLRCRWFGSDVCYETRNHSKLAFHVLLKFLAQMQGARNMQKMLQRRLLKHSLSIFNVLPSFSLCHFLNIPNVIFLSLRRSLLGRAPFRFGTA